MARWRQTINPETGNSEFIPIDNEARTRDGHFVHGTIEAFVSPIDGTIISDRKHIAEHCAKHGVVPAQEFTQEHYEKSAKARADHYSANRSKEERFKIRQQIYETWTREERKHGW